MYFLLVIIILLLLYIAFFTPEVRHKREIKRVQKLFNTKFPEPPIFNIHDTRNVTHPDEPVMYIDANGKKTRSHCKLAVLLFKMEEKV